MHAQTRARPRALLAAVLTLAMTGLLGSSLGMADPAAARDGHHLPHVRLGARRLGPHMRGTDVRALQRDASRLKQPTGPDGVYGKGTYKSVRRLERRRGWVVDGQVGRSEAVSIKGAVRAQHDRKLAQAIAGKAQLQPDGTALAPADAPEPIRNAINAANRIRTKPYVWGGGHGAWEAKGYDCSGAVSYVLHAAGLLSSPMTSGALRHWGYAGMGQWIAVYANKSHAWMTVAGLRFDTSSAGESWNQGSGPRWRASMRSGAGYAVRFSPGL